MVYLNTLRTFLFFSDPPGRTRSLPQYPPYTFCFQLPFNTALTSPHPLSDLQFPPQFSIAIMGNGFSLYIVDAALAGVGLFIIKQLFTPKKTPAPLPPGPKPKPLIGNLTDLPPPGEQEWVHWGKHKELYGALTLGLCYSEIVNLTSCSLHPD